MPVRRSFVQQGTQSDPQPGLLASLVHNRDRRGLDLYLLLKAVASATPFDSHRAAAVWARALRHTGVTATEQTISKIWSRLESMQLVSRAKLGRLANVTLLHEDGSGTRYRHPANTSDAYLQLPVAYWIDEDDQWCSTLRLPAKAMLLIEDWTCRGPAAGPRAAQAPAVVRSGVAPTYGSTRSAGPPTRRLLVG